jgi:5'-nucleotidase
LGGDVSAQAMNDIGYNIMALGNHEFDDGVDVLGQFIKNLTFPVLSSNIDLETSPALKDAGVKPYIVLPKYKLGVIGYITKTTPDIVAQKGLKGTKFMDPIITVQKSIDELLAQGIKRIICVSHNGYTQDQELASKTKGINVIVGGHSHSLLLNNATLGPVGPYPTKVLDLNQSPTYIVQAHRFGNYLGHLELEWNDQDALVSISGDPILLDQTVPQEPKLKAKVAEWSKSFDVLANDILTSATQDFTNTCKNGECAMGNLVTDCMLSEQREKGSNADIAMINSGGIRAALSKGIVTAADMYTIFPFGSAVVQIKRTGAQVMDMLDRIVKSYAPGSDRVISLLQYSGLRYTFNNGTVKAMTNVTVGGNAIDMQAIYDFITVDFVAEGGGNIMDKVDFVPGDLLVEQLVRCLRRQPLISPNLDGRIVVTN